MKRIGGFLRILVPALFLAAGIGYALHVHEGYARGQREYKELDNEYIFSVDSDYGRDERDPKESEIHGSCRTDIDETDDTEKEDVMQEKRIWKPLITPLPEDAPERFSVNWKELLAKNEDVVAWIRVPAIEISYPVLQAEDNDYRTNYAKDITAMLRESYGMDEDIGVLQTFIPFSVKIQEANSEGISIFRYAPKCKAADSFANLTREVLGA